LQFQQANQISFRTCVGSGRPFLYDHEKDRCFHFFSKFFFKAGNVAVFECKRICMDFLDKIYAQDFSLNANTLNSFDPFARERNKVLEPIRRRIHNASPKINRLSYNEKACLKHSNRLVTEILRQLKRLEGYTMHSGQAFSVRYAGHELRSEEVAAEEVFEIRNIKSGSRLKSHLRFP
jgi:hypothetical protein